MTTQPSVRRLVPLFFSVFIASTTSAIKTYQKFVGLPETGDRVDYSNASEHSRTLIIRHNLPGKIFFYESSEFWIELLTTTPEDDNNSLVKISYTALADNNSILLEVYAPQIKLSADTNGTEKLLVIIFSALVSFFVLGLMVSALCYFCYWKKRRKTDANESVEDISRTSSPSSSRASLNSVGPSPSGTQFLVVAICACVLHAQLQTANMEITIYFPREFLRSDSRVFLKSENNNEVRVATNDTRLKINIFDVPDAGFIFEDRCFDKNTSCINGVCDPLVGKCVCPRRMRAIRLKGGNEEDMRCVFKCDQKCQSGFFEVSSCNHTHQAVCKKCRPQCSFKEFESVQCTGKTDRNCTDISQLPHIQVSPNIVYEDVLKAKDDIPLRKTVSNDSSSSSLWFNRSSGLAIKLRILTIDYGTTFREVKHDANDNSKLPKDVTSQIVLRELCSSPVPDYYRIDLKESSENVQIIKGQPNTPCPRYDGKLKTLPTQGNILSCNGAENPVVRLFGVENRNQDYWKEESSKACHTLRNDCNKCRNECTISSLKNPVCSLTRSNTLHDSKQEYGEHFMYCFDCCFRENCTCSSCACTHYKSSCIDSQVTCVREKQFIIPITPVFSSGGHFKCHVKLSRGPVFEFEASLWKDGKFLRKIQEKREKNYTQETGRETTSYDYGYIVLRHSSKIRNNLGTFLMISGKVGESNYSVGWYKTEQKSEPHNTTDKLFIQPTEPFKINTNSWPQDNCQTFDAEKFLVISPKASINNFEELTQVTAKVAHEDSGRVYKVFNNSGSQEVHVEVPSERSILQHVYPGTVILNDNSFAGKLLRNRTFWTIRLTGRVSTCPGFFVARLTDQDRPDVNVYYYDIAIKNEDCLFQVEFNLPSGGDANLIDKQFVVRLTDSRKTLKLILVSPRRIPEFKPPDNDETFDLKKLEVFIPFGGAAGGMLLFFLAILIYGYKTRPKDSYHRDRDNELHFRHILFVVWFVGVRLVKSFLLTLTALFVILTAIHHTNVKTLEKYKTFHEQQAKLEEKFLQEMDKHKAQEIDRQWSLLREGKAACEKNLKALNVFLEKHFREMRERQEEEMKRKSILYAAEDRIKKQFSASKAKFEKERKRLNERLEAYSNEINTRISQIQAKIEKSFWLKVAKGLYKSLDGLSRAFGGGGIKKPFIEWVGLSVNFPSVKAKLPSFDDIFQTFDSEPPIPSKRAQDINLTMWQRKTQISAKVNIQQVSAPNVNISRNLRIERAEELLALEWIVQLYRNGIFISVLIVFDVLWFVYRHCRTYQLAIVLLHGFPKVFKLEEIQKKEEKKEAKKKRKEEKARINKQKNEARGNEKETNVDEFNMKNQNLKDSSRPPRFIDSSQESLLDQSQDSLPNVRNDQPDKEITLQESKSKRATRLGLKGLDNLNRVFLKFLVKLKQLNYQINNTNFVPMCLLLVIAILSVYVVIITAKHSMNVETMEIVGYLDLKMAPLLTMRKIVNTRITSNAFLVNDVHIPYYENRVNTRISFYRKKAEMYQAYQCAKADLHNEEYCSWAQEPGMDCDGVGPYNKDFLNKLTQFECNLEPVIPQRFTKFDRFRYKEVHKKALSPYLAALRGVILDTFYMFLVIIGIVILSKVLEIALFFLLKRFDLVRQVKHYQTHRDLKGELSVPHCIKYPSNESIIRHVGPLHMSNEMIATFGSNIHEGKSIQWIK